MGIRGYLPSAQFTLIASSIALSIGLVYAAQYATQASTTSTIISTSPDNTGAARLAEASWEATLASLQSDGSAAVLPPTPDTQTVEQLRESVKSPNLTDTVSRTLLINLTNAKAQGLGSDIPTQDQLVANALEQINSSSKAVVYAHSDLTTEESTQESKRAYGNAVISTLNSHPQANMQDTLLVISRALETNDPSELAALKPIKADYQALTTDLLSLPVPQTLEPFHFELVNNFSRLTSLYADMEAISTDPLRGLGGLQQYRLTAAETERVFINIARSFDKDAILWNKDEPGALWKSLLSAQ